MLPLTSDVMSLGFILYRKKLKDIRPNWIEHSITESDSAFILGLTQLRRPQRCIEIGVASGWGSVVILSGIMENALQTAGHDDRQLTGVDVLDYFYRKPSKPVGAAVAECIPEHQDRYQVHSKLHSVQIAPKLGSLDFAFIDGNHKHPWATLDLISIYSNLSENSTIVLHDINLCRTNSEKPHSYRGPYYLYHSWPFDRITTEQLIPTIGALILRRKTADVLESIFEVLATPWEEDIGDQKIAMWNEFIYQNFGSKALESFKSACAAGRKSIL